MKRALPIVLLSLTLLGAIAGALAQDAEREALEELAPSEPLVIEDEEDPYETSGAPLTPPGSPAVAGGAAAAGAAMAGVMGVFFLMYFLFIMLIWVIAIGAWVVKILAVYDCARRDFDDPGTRAIWCVLIVLTSWIGALIYYIMIYRAATPGYQVKRPPAAAPVPEEGEA